MAERRRLAGVKAARALVSRVMTQADPATPESVPIMNQIDRLNMGKG